MKRSLVSFLVAAAFGPVMPGCSGSRAPAGTPAAAPRACPDRAAAPLELVESAPVETSLDHPCIRNASEVWPELLGSARHAIDLASFYASARAGEALDPVIEALAAARARGVRVRILLDARLSKTYADTWKRLTDAGLEVRTLDTATSMGGVMHAKYFVVDGRRGFSGSQNFDWRSLTHIQELGVRFEDTGLARQLESIFDMDWRLAGGEEVRSTAGRDAADEGSGAPEKAAPAELVSGAARVVASPTGWLPPGIAWDEPVLVDLMDRARSSLRLQLLTYGTRGRGGERYTVLADALARAAARGVRVQVMVSDWCKSPKYADDVAALAATPGIEVRMISIPEHSSGPIDFARVAHTKLLVVDGATAWVGSSNWGRDYFHESRNAGFVISDPGVVSDASRVFDDTWASRYVAPLAPTPVTGTR